MKLATPEVIILLLFFTAIASNCKHTHHSHESKNSSEKMHKEDHDDHAHDHNHANEHMNERPFEELVDHFESTERAEWQKPDEVVALLGDLKGKTVMEIGSGTGYFSFRLAKAGAKAISADVDERFLKYIGDRKTKEGISDEQVEPRHVPYDSPNLKEAEVDMVLTVNTYHHIENREDYFAKVKTGLKKEGKLVIVDFFKKETPMGPPVEMKISAEKVIEELRAAGFTDFEVNRDLLPYQYIVFAY